jgi:hypothetical protein
MIRKLAIAALALSLSFGITACGDKDAPAPAAEQAAEAQAELKADPNDADAQRKLNKSILSGGAERSRKQRAEREKLHAEGNGRCFNSQGSFDCDPRTGKPVAQAQSADATAGTAQAN